MAAFVMLTACQKPSIINLSPADDTSYFW